LNLPPAVIACYQRSGISHLFAWQAECLEKASASGTHIPIFQFYLNNLFKLFIQENEISSFLLQVYLFKHSPFILKFICVIASAGKTIVSELLLIKSVLETKRKALFIEPYVSIVQEKANYFRVSFPPLSNSFN
jgi:DNA polymerase theta